MNAAIYIQQLSTLVLAKIVWSAAYVPFPGLIFSCIVHILTRSQCFPDYTPSQEMPTNEQDTMLVIMLIKYNGNTSIKIDSWAAYRKKNRKSL